MAKKYKIIISDCHLSAGRFVEGRFNPHEDFFFDREMVEFFEHFSSGAYGEGPEGPVEVELIINGDFFDFLNIPYLGEFEEGITEEIALVKLHMALRGHPEVMSALKAFASKPGKTITYLVGNHDAELFFDKVRERIVREWDPEGKYPSRKVKLVVNQDFLSYPEGLEVRHGNQHEASNALDFENPFIDLSNGVRVLNIPFGSIYILKILNRLKWERPNLDKVRPLKVYAFFGLLFDFGFTMRFILLTLFYFLKTRILARSKLYGFKATMKLFQQERKAFLDLSDEARELLQMKPEVKTVIFGHTHLPMNRLYSDGRQYINTGTWTRMVYLDWRFIGDPFRKTFALVEMENGRMRAELNQWQGSSGVYQTFMG